MDNHARRVGYVRQNTGMDAAAADRLVRDAYAAGTEDTLLRPGQLRRVKHNRGQVEGVSRHRARQRTARAERFRRRLELLGLA